MPISGKARVAGVMGWPVAHSLSPRLHGYWLEHYGIDGAYVPMPVAPGKLPDALAGLDALGFVGANITVPHKETALAVVDQADESARAIGAVNTVSVWENGSLHGTNSDGAGFVANVRDFIPAWTAHGKKIAILGAGGSARAIAWTLLNDGAAEVRIVNRTTERAQALASSLGKGARAVPWTVSAPALEDADMLVNATTLGMVQQPRLGIGIGPLPKTAVVVDIVYNPQETDLLRRARSRGNPVVDGIGMLLHQARPGFAAWFGREPEVTAELRRHVLAGIA